MQDYEYMYEVCLCTVLEDRSHMETLLSAFKLTGRKGGSVCRVQYGLISSDFTDIKEKKGITENR